MLSHHASKQKKSRHGFAMTTFFYFCTINLIAVGYAQEKPPLEEQPDKAPAGMAEEDEDSR